MSENVGSSGRIRCGDCVEFPEGVRSGPCAVFSDDGIERLADSSPSCTAFKKRTKTHLAVAAAPGIRERLEVSTPGTWEHHPYRDWIRTKESERLLFVSWVDDHRSREDREFAVCAHNVDIPVLLDGLADAVEQLAEKDLELRLSGLEVARQKELLESCESALENAYVGEEEDSKRIADLEAQLAAAVEGLEKISNIKVDYTWPEEMVRLRNEICTDTLAKVKALGETEKVENKDGEG